MFEAIADKMSRALRAIRGLHRISEANVTDALAHVKTALLGADVHYKVAKDFIARVQERCLGQKVLLGVTPGQQLIREIHAELVALLGGDGAADFFGRRPLKLVLVGLHGSGKTTTSVKLAVMLREKAYRPAVIACDVHRPAAIDQLEQLAQKADIPFYSLRGETDVLSIAAAGLSWAEGQAADAILWDTAGRLQIDEPLIQELKDLRMRVKPQEILLVADAALGQEAVNVAQHFHKAVSLTGIILSKMDGDARGGAALSMKSVAQVPIRFIGTGEKVSDLEIFHAERVAQRILGMGDIVSLVEKTEAVIDRQESEKLAEKIRRSSFSLEDFLQHLRRFQTTGSIGSLLQYFPNSHHLSSEEADRRFKRLEAMISSMTPQERRHPEILHGQRRLRIARGSGTKLAEVNSLLKQFRQMQQMMKRTKSAQGRRELQRMMAQMDLEEAPSLS
ncbi:MAG: signal recognition particle protein [Puniceicoccales bacterium]|jgi:signal recognition particle subunit SRP54|nr:signal recognition particle protein [Puniceicoccales bacterium]